MIAVLGSRLARWETLLGVLLVGLLIVASASTPGFASAFNISNSLSEMSEKSLMVLPLALIIVAREIDISIASIAGLSGVMFGIVLLHHGALWEAMTVALLVGAACGVFNGFCVTVLGLPSLIVTLGALALFRGLCYMLIGGTPITDVPTALTDFGNNNVYGTVIPQDFVPFLILAPIFGIILHRTATGRRIYAIGANPETAAYAGVRANKIRFWLFVTSGVMCAAAGIILVGRTTQAAPDGALGFELDAITVVFLGGLSVLGGKGRMIGVCLALLLVTALRSVLLLEGASGYTQGTAVGLLLIVSLLMTNVVRRLSHARASRRLRVARETGSGESAPLAPG